MVVIAAEGLYGMMKNVVTFNLFKGFQVNEHVKYNLLQFTNDTLMVREAFWENIWAIKALVKGFEMASVLSINMRKSNLYGVGIREQFMQVASLFLSCKWGLVPLKPLGMHVGCNPRRLEA